MVSDKWILIEDARELIVEHHLKVMDSGAIASAYQFAHDRIKEGLIEGTLPSRPGDATAYSLIFNSYNGEIRIPLEQPNDMIPTTFWHYYFEARNQEILCPPSRTSTDYWDGEHHSFQYSHQLKDNGVIEGMAGSVLVLRSKLPGNLPRKRGERGKNKKYAEDETDVVQRAVMDLESGVSRREVFAKFAPQMPGGKMTLPASKSARLRGRLKERGYLPGHTTKK